MKTVELKHRTPGEQQAYMEGYEAGKRDSVKTGSWIDHQMDRWIYAKCSECGDVWEVKSNFCPNCGCRMKEGE